MTNMLQILNKQLQLLEIELGDFMIAKNQGFSYSMPEEYYAGIAHAVKGLQLSVYTLKKAEKIGFLGNQVH